MNNLKRLWLVFFLFAAIALVLFFVLENQQAVALAIFGWTLPEVPVSVVVIAAFVMGLVIGPVIGACIVLRGRERTRAIRV